MAASEGHASILGPRNRGMVGTSVWRTNLVTLAVYVHRIPCRCSSGSHREGTMSVPTMGHDVGNPYNKGGSVGWALAVALEVAGSVPLTPSLHRGHTVPYPRATTRVPPLPHTTPAPTNVSRQSWIHPANLRRLGHTYHSQQVCTHAQ